MHKINLFILFASLLFLSHTVSFGQKVVPQQVVKQYGKPFSRMPDPRDVVIYQVNIRTFSEAGDFKGVTARIDSIKALGANVIYLMPIYPVGSVKSVNSPYCIQNYTEVNKEFGNLNDLRELISAAHKKDMAVILDWVANHTSYDHVWTKNKSWYQQDENGDIIYPKGTGWRDVAQLNFDNSEMRTAMINAMKYWILAANADGFRCDYSDGPPFDFWKDAVSALRALPNRELLMLSEGKRSDHYAAGFDYNFGFKFFETLKEIYSQNVSALLIDSLNIEDYVGASEGQRIVRYTTNHDVNGSDGTPQELFGGERGAMAAFVVISYMKSIPMVYNGQEVGTPFRLTFPFVNSKIDWKINPKITAEYKKILAFRNNSPAIRRGTLASFSTKDVCVFQKELGDEKVLVISNLRNQPVNFSIPSEFANSTWKDAFNAQSIKLNKELVLAPFTYLVLNK